VPSISSASMLKNVRILIVALLRRRQAYASRAGVSKSRRG